MARRNQGRQGRGGQDESRGTDEQQRERGRWRRDAGGDPGWRPEYGAGQGPYASEPEPRDRRGWDREREWEGEFGGGREERFGSTGYGGAYGRREYGGEYRSGPYPGEEHVRERYERYSDPRGQGGYRDPSRHPEYGPYGVRPYQGGAQPRPEPETYGETQRWERTRPDMGRADMGGAYYSGGAYAGGAFGGGARGPGGFGTRGWSPEVWQGVTGSGRTPDWVEDMEHPEQARARDYSGRGPKGYQRSDERITEDVCDGLTRHPFIDASDISVRCENGEVTLSGTVDDRREKRLAEDSAERVTGVVEVRNEIRVNRPTGSGSEGWSRGSSQGRASDERRGEDEQREDEQTRRGSSSSRNRTGSKG